MKLVIFLLSLPSLKTELKAHIPLAVNSFNQTVTVVSSFSIYQNDEQHNVSQSTDSFGAYVTFYDHYIAYPKLCNYLLFNRPI